jgi:lysyl-tRNA synthetase class 2
MLRHGRVIAVDHKDRSTSLTLASDGNLSEVVVPEGAADVPVGAFVAVRDDPSGVARIEVLGAPAAAPSEDAARWWRLYSPRASRMQRLKQRARIVRALRDTLDGEDFTEVQAPLLVRATCPDLHIESFRAGDGYLTTSTEYQLKRMFAGGFERLYTLTQNFRAGDLGSRHNPEFTMLEWARAYASLGDIERDAEALVRRALAALDPDATSVTYAGHTVEVCGSAWERLSVREALERHLGVSPDECFSLASMRAETERLGLEIPAGYRDDAVDLLTVLLDRAQPKLGTRVPTFLVDWPSSLTTSAPPRAGAPHVAERSELFIAGVEVADGFPFLRDAALQARLFEESNARRLAAGRMPVRLDTRYVEALRAALPPGAGMAMGVDRLVMVLTGEDDIRNVLAFAWDEL